MDIREKLLAAFRIEYREHLEYIRGIMAGLEAGETDPSTLPLDEVFRRAHSLKGAARATDMKPVEILAHRLETLFGRVKAGRIDLDGEALSVIHRVGDAIEDCVAALLQGDAAADPAPVLAMIDAFLAGRPDESRKDEGGKPEPLPPSPSSPSPTPPLPPTAEEPPPPEQASERRPAPVVQAVRVQTSSLDRLLRSAGLMATGNLIQDALTGRLKGIEQELALLERNWSALRQDLIHRGPVGEDDAGGDRRVAWIEQHIRGINRDLREIRLTQQRAAWTYRQQGADLQDDIRRVRMIPAESVFADFRKMMRDLARDEGKDLEFRLLGLGVEADRLVFQSLKDPVMHMLRNAVFHGIESPAERGRKGKDAKGRVTLRFETDGSRLIVLIDDDGRGIDLEKVAAKALLDGVATRDEIEAGSQNLLRHIFRPGFSTAGRITDLAGRGMGLSVVYETVSQLSGSLEVLEREGPGTAIRIEVPLSVSSHHLMLVTCQDRTYCLPATGVSGVMRVPVTGVHTVEGRPMIEADDTRVPLRGLADVLGLDDADIRVSDGIMPVVVLRSGERRAAVAVDSFVAIREAVIKDLGIPRFPGIKAVGGILLEDGTVSVVLSPFELVESFSEKAKSTGFSATERAPAIRPPTIMVVDDSITTRTLEKSILEAHGYRVRIAVDGLDALIQLRAEAADLVVSDVEMPRIDGFSLLKELKRDRNLSHIPVILVTSLRRDDDVERGFSLGAEAYLVKQKFDQRELLETIEQIL